MKWCEKRVVVSMKLLMKVVIKGSDDRSGYRIKCGSDNAKGLGKKKRGVQDTECWLPGMCLPVLSYT